MPPGHRGSLAVCGGALEDPEIYDTTALLYPSMPAVHAYTRSPRNNRRPAGTASSQPLLRCDAARLLLPAAAAAAACAGRRVVLELNGSQPNFQKPSHPPPPPPPSHLSRTTRRGPSPHSQHTTRCSPLDAASATPHCELAARRLSLRTHSLLADELQAPARPSCRLAPRTTPPISSTPTTT
jgi:hypothetical protein